MNNYAIFGRQNDAIYPRFDALEDTRRLDPNAPVVEATLRGRRVFLSRPDPLTRRPGEPYQLTIPLTTARFRYARDIELDRATMPFEPTPIAGEARLLGEDRKGEFLLFVGVLLGLAALAMRS